MPEAITKDDLVEVHKAFDEFKKTVEAKSIDETKLEKIEEVLDNYETKNQEITAAHAQVEAHETSITKFKEELEEKGVEAGKMREQLDAFELALAKTISSNENADYREGSEFKAFEAFALVGDKATVEQKAELRTDAATEGGVLVTSEMDSQIVKNITEIDAMRQVARVKPIAAKSIVVPIETSIPVAVYEGEAETGTESTGAYGSETLTAFRLTHTVPITRDMLMDAAFDMEAEILDSSARAFAFGEGQGFITGSGHKEPYGFLNDSRIGGITSTTNDVISGDDLLEVQGDLKTGYNGTFMLNRRTLSIIRRERNASQGYLWTPGLDGPAMSTLGGDPYVLSNTMPDVADGAKAVAYGDFGLGYMIVDRTATEVIRDDLTRKKEAIVEFTIHRWNTGKVILPEAIKIITIQ